jgi:uncharacterized protein DUF4375
MAEEKQPSDAMLKAFAAVRTVRSLEPFPAWPYKRALSKDELIENSDLAWDAFLSIVGDATYEELSLNQQVAYLGYWYEAEVYNGGHWQFFRNFAGRYVAETIAALPLLGAEAHARVLKEAFERKRAEPGITGNAKAGPFDDFDRAYWQCKPELDELLHRYLDEHLGDFILFKDDA